MPTLPNNFRCNRCLKKNFKSQASVIRHQLQPRSQCRIRYEKLQALKLLNIQRLPQSTFSTSSTSNPNQIPSQMIYTSTLPNNNHNNHGFEYSDATFDPCPSNNVQQEEQHHDIDNPWKSAQDHLPYFVKEYTGSAQIFGTGPTFLDKFDMDKYSPHRKTNLYYPFASREEWEYSFFLVRSNMNLAHVDELLKLEKV